MTLNGRDLERLRDAFVAAYDLSSLEMLLRLKLNRRLDTLVSPVANFETVVFQLLDTAERTGWLQDLMETATEDRAQNSTLVAICGEFIDKYATPSTHLAVPNAADGPSDMMVPPSKRRRIVRPISRPQRPELLRPSLTVALAPSVDNISMEEEVRELRLSSADWVPYYEVTNFIDAVVPMPGRTPRKARVDLPPHTVYVAFRLLNVGNIAAEKLRVRIRGEGVRFRYGNRGMHLIFDKSRVWEVEIPKSMSQGDGDMLEVRGSKLSHGDHYDTYELLMTLEGNRTEYTLEWHGTASNDKRQGGLSGELTISVDDSTA